MGYVLLAGGGEFSGAMSEPDRRAIALAGGTESQIDIVPTAAAPDNNHHRAGSRGVQWFKGLGATRVDCRLLIDRVSADEPPIAESLSHARLIYMLGGFPAHLADSLRGTRSWDSMVKVYGADGVLGGSSAGAMVLGENFYNPARDRLEPGLRLMSGLCLIPHFNSVGGAWSKRLRRLLPRALLLGIDEETAIINDGAAGGWTVYGKGAVSLHRPSGAKRFISGEEISPEHLPSPDR
ncbi:MAG: Type 1 glutamine amidotransferase-like domain-containing protein [bacterium]|nr:Type 1 glutamine amidotransferase-like domain-containing protein [bacterium]